MDLFYLNANVQAFEHQMDHQSSTDDTAVTLDCLLAPTKVIGNT